MPANTLHFRVERHDDEDGIYYVVNGIEIALTTDGETLEEALHNLREAVDLYYEGDDLPRHHLLDISMSIPLSSVDYQARK